MARLHRRERALRYALERRKWVGASPLWYTLHIDTVADGRRSQVLRFKYPISRHGSTVRGSSMRAGPAIQKTRARTYGFSAPCPVGLLIVFVHHHLAGEVSRQLSLP